MKKIIFLFLFMVLVTGCFDTVDVVKIKETIEHDNFVDTVIVGDLRVDTYEVTIESYCVYFPEMRDKLIKRIKRKNPTGPPLKGDIEDYPAIVYFDDAIRYAEARGVRLPTIDEYKFIAHGNGQHPIGNVLEISGISCARARGQIMPVNYKGSVPNGYGVYNMMGNTPEWETGGKVFGLGWSDCLPKMKKDGTLDLFIVGFQLGISGFRCVEDIQ